MNFGTLVIAAGIFGLLSFTCLAVAIGSEYWYIIDVDEVFNSTWEFTSSHSGLWRIYEDLHRVIVIILPISLVLLVFGGIFGLVGSLSHSYCILTAVATYFLICSLFTLSGVGVYVSYSQQTLDELRRLESAELLAHVHVSYGWSLAMACLSYSLEVATGALLGMAAWLAHGQRQRESAATPSVA
ncbi:transmembrane protein 235 isoform X2 [Electrophorus electricus]|uniref:transmembrane protein 235 isoform X2 n=1 Tax=Electrophorus electricus TaxID=8005 RepID=UPI0015D0BB7E|nr:transmembrane protein 235 isoform X2 [Electrophorus electricus]